MRILQPESYRKFVAYHEAGHAIADIIFGFHFDFVTIKPNDYFGYDGIVQGGNSGKLSDIAVVQLAGIVATAKMIGCDPWRTSDLFGYNNPDIMGANDFIDKWTDFLLKTKGEVIHGKQAWNEIEGRTRLLIDQNWKYIEIVADALLKMETLTYDDVMAILKARCPDSLQE